MPKFATPTFLTQMPNVIKPCIGMPHDTGRMPANLSFLCQHRFPNKAKISGSASGKHTPSVATPIIQHNSTQHQYNKNRCRHKTPNEMSKIP